MRGENLFNHNGYTGQYEPVSIETRREAHHAVNKCSIKEAIREFAYRAVKPFHAFELSEAIGMTLLAIRPRLTEMYHSGELKITGKIKTQYSRTPVCLYEKN
jgi:hypothetical protein